MKNSRTAIWAGGCFLFVMAICGGCTTFRAGTKAEPTKLLYEKVLLGKVSDYEVMWAEGRWGREYLLKSSRVGQEGFNIQGIKGRSCADNKAWLMIRNVKTQKGEAVSLAYSGNWRIEVLPEGDNTRLRACTLPESLGVFKTAGGVPFPGALVADFKGEWDNGAQKITRYIRKNLLRDMGKDWPLVMYNTWYDRAEKIDEGRLKELAKTAAGMGCELFVIDAGWYGNAAVWSDSLGDWTVNRERLPNGIGPIADEVHRLGMKFGIWVEIENVHENIAVAKEHPEWLLHDGQKIMKSWGGRMTMDLGNEEALAWVTSQIDGIVSGFGLDYIKMDFNADLMVDVNKPRGEVCPLWKHYRGLVRLWDHMREKYPKLIIENCSSGSLRYDVMSAAETDTHWVSDEVKNEYNLAMNFGATYLFPPEICSHWTCYPAASDAMDVESCFTANMLGQMGLSGDIIGWDAKTRACAAERIALYKDIRPVIRNSDVYHLTEQLKPEKPNMVQAAQYMDGENGRAVVFVFQAGDPAMQVNLRLRGLKEKVSYRVKMPEGFGCERSAKGEELMTTGLQVKFPHRGASAVIEVTSAN